MVVWWWWLSSVAVWLAELSAPPWCVPRSPRPHDDVNMRPRKNGAASSAAAAPAAASYDVRSNYSDVCHAICFYETALGPGASVPGGTVTPLTGIPTPELVEVRLSCCSLAS